MNKKLAIKDIAKLAGVTSSTVSKALNNYDSIRPELKEKIRKIALENHYQASFQAASLRRQSSFCLGAILPSFRALNSDFYQDILSGMEWALGESRYSLLLMTLEQREQIESNILQGRVEALIILGDTISNEELTYLKESGLPLVFTNFKPEIKPEYGGCFQLDHRHATELLIQEMARIKDKQNWLFVHGGDQYQISRLRKTAFEEMAKKYSIEYRVLNCDFAEESGGARERIRQFLKNHETPNAVICASDPLAIGVMNGLDLKNLRDIPVAGYDGLKYAMFTAHPFFTANYDLVKIGRDAIKIFLDNNESPEKMRWQENMLHAELLTQDGASESI